MDTFPGLNIHIRKHGNQFSKWTISSISPEREPRDKTPKAPSKEKLRTTLANFALNLGKPVDLQLVIIGPNEETKRDSSSGFMLNNNH
jgi:hypothetical protein